MSERYYATGVQLGMIKAFIESKQYDKILKVLDQIEDKQFIGNVPQGREWKSDIMIVSEKKKKAKK